MKKIIWFVCFATMLTALMVGASLTASAEVVEGACGNTYNCDTDQYDNVKWSFNTETGVMTIFGEGKMGSWFWGEAPWYSYRNQIKSVVIAEGVTHISDYSFTNHTVMTDVSIPASVISIYLQKKSGCLLPKGIEHPLFVVITVFFNSIAMAD